MTKGTWDSTPVYNYIDLNIRAALYDRIVYLEPVVFRGRQLSGVPHDGDHAVPALQRLLDDLLTRRSSRPEHRQLHHIAGP